jgi:hypothetical protein
MLLKELCENFASASSFAELERACKPEVSVAASKSISGPEAPGR